LGEVEDSYTFQKHLQTIAGQSLTGDLVAIQLNTVAKSPNVTAPHPLVIGIDTGGTYTDAVVYARDADEIVAKVKVRTTHEDLGGCVARALKAVLLKASVDAPDIHLVCVSTTLATNALVEGGGRPAGLIAIGLEPGVTERRGLAALTEENPLLRLAGGHSPYGLESVPLDLSPLQNWLAENDEHLEAYAVVGAFSVRNPEHELAVAEAIEEITGKPTTLSHELSGQLDAAKRSVTALLNARLLPLVREMIVAVENSMVGLGIRTQLMVVRGDGSLVSCDFVKTRPIETILSGPAASAAGAAALSGVRDGVIVDVGGTTTDIAVIREGKPASRTGGAKVAGYETMVSAIRVHTEGIGGDSHVRHTPLRSKPLSIGPRRVTPLALASSERPQLLGMLEAQLSRPVRNESDGIYLWVQDNERRWTPQSSVEAKVFDAACNFPDGISLEDLVTSGLERNATDRMVGLGILGITAFTPTDAAHVLGIDERFDPLASKLGAKILAGQLDRVGVPLADTGSLLAAKVLSLLSQGIGAAVFTAGADHDGLPSPELESTLQALQSLTTSAVDNQLLEISLSVKEPLVCVGAAAPIYHEELSRYLKTTCTAPTNFDVANAYGAAIGSIIVSRSTMVSAPRRGLFRVHVTEPQTFYDFHLAQAFAEKEAEGDLARRMHLAGAAKFTIDHRWTLREVDVEGRPLFIEASLQSEAEGAPIGPP
tara:strand:+ start:585 stop:2717 length:2133 start_codon:yes stop_codon:yes gene_type:complete